MGFDRTDAADLAALKSEVLSDPTGRGYNPDASEAILLDQLNNPDQNLTPATGPDFLTPENLLKALMPVSISSQDQFKLQLIYEGTSGFQDDLSIFRADLKPLSNGISDAIDGIIRSLSRAEVLFSEDDANGSRERVSITVDDWRAARDS